MKKTIKIVSVALALVLAFSVFMVPTFAETPLKVSAEVVATKKTATAGGLAGKDYYQFDVYVESNLTLAAFYLYPVWEKSAWDPIDASRAPSMNAITSESQYKGRLKKCVIIDPKSVFGEEMANMGFETPDGDWLDTAILKPVSNLISDTNLGSLVGKYTGLNYNWDQDVAAHAINISGCTINGLNSPMAGKQLVCSFCLAPKKDATGIHEVGFITGEKFMVTGSYFKDDSIAADTATNTTTFTSDMVTYKNAMVNLGGEVTPAGPVLNRTKTQVKAKGADRFLLRTMNSISAADFTALNGDADVIKNIVSAGFVVTSDATWNADAAEEAIASGSTANYQVGKTNYFYKNPAGTYEFGCLLDAPLAQGTNFQYCAFIEYKDAQGATQYLFYKDGAVNLTFEQVDTALKTPMA